MNFEFCMNHKMNYLELGTHLLRTLCVFRGLRFETLLCHKLLHFLINLLANDNQKRINHIDIQFEDHPLMICLIFESLQSFSDNSLFPVSDCLFLLQPNHQTDSKTTQKE